MNKKWYEVLKAIVYVLGTLIGVQVCDGCSIIGHADNVYETPHIEGSK